MLTIKGSHRVVSQPYQSHQCKRIDWTVLSRIITCEIGDGWVFRKKWSNFGWEKTLINTDGPRNIASAGAQSFFIISIWADVRPSPHPGIPVFFGRMVEIWHGHILTMTVNTCEFCQTQEFKLEQSSIWTRFFWINLLWNLKVTTFHSWIRLVRQTWVILGFLGQQKSNLAVFCRLPRWSD